MGGRCNKTNSEYSVAYVRALSFKSHFFDKAKDVNDYNNMSTKRNGLNEMKINRIFAMSEILDWEQRATVASYKADN